MKGCHYDIAGISGCFINFINTVFYICYYFFFKLKLKKTEKLNLSQQVESENERLNYIKKVIESKTIDLEKLQTDKKHLLDLEENENRIRAEVNSLEEQEKKIRKKTKKLKKESSEASDKLLSLKEGLSIYQPIHDLANLGFFEDPEYLFETSIRYKEEIKKIREEQKTMISAGKAISFPEVLAMSDNKTYVNKIFSGQEKLMLKAFNSECDNLMELVKASNYDKVLDRINKTATELEKSSVAMKCRFNLEYIRLKYKECEMQYHFKLKQDKEKEEQAIIKEQIREEQKVIKEYERAIAKAEKEERAFRDAIEKARKELEQSRSSDNEKLIAKIADLELKLKIAEENEKRAKSMAEMTRKGHVYIISNIGSFGESVYKIGLTRRLEPLDRVKELGDASVPFPFDVHAMIFSEDAPALEANLHKEFRLYRVNKVNHRKEFFNVDLNQIREKVVELTGSDYDFKITALAEDYYESLKLSSSSSLLELETV